MEDKQKKKNSIGFKIFIIILVGMILFFLKEENQKKFIQFIDNTRSVDIEAKITESIPVEEDTEKILIHGEGMILWKENHIIKLDIGGSKEWEREFVFEEPAISVGEQYIYVYEKPSGIIHFLNSSGETVHRVDLKARIMNIVESYENILVHIKTKDIERINILDMEGKTIEDALIKNKNILTYSINKDGATYIISSLDLKGDGMKSEEYVFKKGNQSLFNMEFKDEMILYSNFIDRNKVVIMTDKGIYMAKDGEILWQRNLQLVKDIYMDKSNIHLLYGNILETISIEGTTEEKKSFTEEYKKIIPFNGYLVVYGDEYIMGLKDGEEVFKYKSDENILEVIEGRENLILRYKDKIELMKLENKI